LTRKLKIYLMYWEIYGAPIIPIKLIIFLRYTAILGFVVTISALIGLNHKILGRFFKDKSRYYWLIFGFSSVLPVLLMAYVYNLFFRY